MADNLTTTATVSTVPVATVIATDDAGAGGHVQRIKLSLSADGSAAPITADADGLLVNLGANNDVTVTGTVTATLVAGGDVDVLTMPAITGTVTANAGTNLNTSALALEAGGNLAGAAASLSVLDDWDESDRAKVNPIVGQAGIAAGTGVDGVTVPRVTLATNVGLPAGTSNIGDVDVLTLPAVTIAAAQTLATVTTVGTVTSVTAIANALPAGTNAIGKLAANSGVDIGDVDVLTLPNVTLAAGTNTNEVVGDVAHDAPAAGNPLLVAGYASAAAPADVSGDADAVRLWALRNGAQATVLTAAGALIGGDAANGIDVDVTRLPTLAAVTTVSTVTNLSQQGGVAISLNTGVRDTGTQRVTIATNDSVPVTFTGSTDVATQTSLASLLTSSQLIDDAIFADDAAFTVGSSKVMAAGHQAVAHGSAPDAADALDAVIGIANRDRVPFVIGGHPNPFTYSMSITTAVTNAIIGTTNSGGTKPVVTGITVVLDNASTVFPTFIIGFGTANTPAMATTPGTAQILASHPGIPAGGGMSRGDGSGILGVGVDGDEIRITTTGTAGGNGLYVTVTGYLVGS